MSHGQETHKTTCIAARAPAEPKKSTALPTRTPVSSVSHDTAVSLYRKSAYPCNDDPEMGTQHKPGSKSVKLSITDDLKRSSRHGFRSARGATSDRQLRQFGPVHDKKSLSIPSNVSENKRDPRPRSMGSGHVDESLVKHRLYGNPGHELGRHRYRWIAVVFTSLWPMATE